jgi:hypothetical protein
MSNTKFQFKRTTVSGRLPNTTNSSNSSYIDAGEFAVNLTDGKVVSSNGSATFEVGANLSSLNVTGNILLANNNTKLQFTAANGSSNVYFIQQNDDNFVFYTTNTSGGTRAVFNIYANTLGTNSNGALRFNTSIDLATSGILANGSFGSSGQVLTSNGSSVYWSTVSGGGGSVNTAAQYTWTNTHTFSSNVSFNDSIGVTNAKGIYLNALSDANWKIGRNIATYTKAYYTNNSLDFLIGSSSLEGITFGNIANTSFLELGPNGGWFRGNVAIGNVAWSSAMLTVGGSANISGNVIAGSTSTLNQHQILSNTQIAPSGSWSSNAYVLFSGYGGNYLGFGQANTNYGFAQWIQSGFTGSNTYYPISLNPLGGNVSIGSITTPTATLSVNGTANISGNVSAGAIVVNGSIITGNTQLGNNQVATVAFAIAVALAL